MGRLDNIVRRSIKKDFANANFKRIGKAPRPVHPLNTKRVVSLNESCEYYRFRKYFVGRLVRIMEKTISGILVEFVSGNDRDKLNAAAGWSSNKRLFLLHGPKFDD